MKISVYISILFSSFVALASDPGGGTNSELSPVLLNTEGAVKVLIPTANQTENVEGALTKIDGKIYQITEGVPGMKIPNGAILQTVGEAKAQVVLENGNSFVAGKATEMKMSWAKDVKGKLALDLNVKDGLVRGIVGNKDELGVNLVTNSFKASMKNAEFITGAIESGDATGAAKSAAKGAVLKMLHGDSKLKPLAKLANLNGSDTKEMLAQAGSDLVMGIKEFKQVPILQSDVLKKATSLSATVDKLKNASGKDFLSQLALSADSIADQVGQQAAPPADNCGCPSLEERLKRAAMNKARAKATSAIKPQEGKDAKKQSDAMTKPQDEKSLLDGLDPITELSCMSPVLSQLKGAAQIIKSLKNGIFSSQEAKEGDCVSNNSLFKSLTDSKSALKFPNGDEIFSSDKTDMIMKWTKKKLDLKLDQGSIRGVFKKSSNRLVNLKAKGINVSTRGGDIQLSAPKSSATQSSNSSSSSSAASSAGSGLSSALGALPNPAAAQLGLAAAAAPAVAGVASGLASGLLGSAVSVFSGLASAGGQALTAGTQLSAGQKIPRKLSAEEISQLQSETSPASKSDAPASAQKNTPETPSTVTTPEIKPETKPASPSTVEKSSTVVKSSTQEPATSQEASSAAGIASSLSGTAAAGGTSATGSVVGSAIGSAVSAVSSGAASSVGVAAAAATLPSSAPLASAVSQNSQVEKIVSDSLKEKAKLPTSQDAVPLESGLWKPSAEQPEEDFIKKYLNF